jgi:hypothetical protein
VIYPVPLYPIEVIDRIKMLKMIFLLIKKERKEEHQVNEFFISNIIISSFEHLKFLVFLKTKYQRF